MFEQNKKIQLVSVIITIYEKYEYLEMVLLALAQQDCDINKLEVIVAEDGESLKIAALVANIQSKLPYPLVHVHHLDQGFRTAMIRNKAVAQSRGDYLIFLDGDCVPPFFFIRRHLKLAEAGYFVNGNRILLREAFTAKVLANKMPIYCWHFIDCLRERWLGGCNRCLPWLFLPLWFLRKIWSVGKWQGAKSCNLAIWRSDFLTVNGFDEKYIGWGYEDSDLVVRLFHAKIARKIGNFAVPVIHLWHKEAVRDNAGSNYKLLLARQQSGEVRAIDGVDKYFN